MHSFWHSQPVVNLIIKICNHHICLNISLLPQTFSVSFLMNLGVMLSVKRWRRCCMWLMEKSQSHSRNVSLRYFLQVLSSCIYKKVKITLGSLFFSDIHACACMGTNGPCLNWVKAHSFLCCNITLICIDVNCSLVYKCRHLPCCFTYCASLKGIISQG